jgi:hypothetical protein
LTTENAGNAEEKQKTKNGVVNRTRLATPIHNVDPPFRCSKIICCSRRALLGVHGVLGGKSLTPPSRER